MDKTSKNWYKVTTIYIILLIVVSFCASSPEEIWSGIKKIMMANDILIKCP